MRGHDDPSQPSKGLKMSTMAAQPRFPPATSFPSGRLAREWRTVTAMLEIYCRDRTDRDDVVNARS